MLINHECIKDLLSVFAKSELAEISISDLVNDSAIRDNYSDEELMFHIQRLCDQGWIITSSSENEPFALYGPGRTPTWHSTEWRWTESANQYWDASSKPEIWSKFKSLSAKESLDFSLDILKGLGKKWIEKKVNEIFEI